MHNRTDPIYTCGYYGRVEGTQFGGVIMQIADDEQIINESIDTLRRSAKEVIAINDHKDKTVHYFKKKLFEEDDDDGRVLIGWRTGECAGLNVIKSENIGTGIYF